MSYSGSNSTQNQLNNLFAIWRYKQENEPLESAKQTAYLLSYKDKFAPDGVIGNERQWDNLPGGVPKVLYILPEPNWGDGTSYQEGYFWFSNVVYANGLNGNKSKKGGNILSNLAIAQHFLETGNSDISTKDYECLKNAAYMNLSKRGGVSSRSTGDKRRLVRYVDYYKDEIKKEIEILNPDIIVCCGSDIKELVMKLLSGIDISPMVIGCWHPSTRKGGMSFLKKLKAAYENTDSQRNI